MTAATNTGMNDMNTPKNAQFIVLTPLNYNSGWSKQECHTEVEAFAIAADLYERGKTEVNVVDIATGTCLPFVPFKQDQLTSA
jgi:hypothetical protein